MTICVAENVLSDKRETQLHSNTFKQLNSSNGMRVNETLSKCSGTENGFLGNIYIYINNDSD